MSVELSSGSTIIVDLHTDNSVAAMRAVARFESQVAESAGANPASEVNIEEPGDGSQAIRSGDVLHIDLAEIDDLPDGGHKPPQ